MIAENRDVWNNIALFESHDYVRGWYARRHGRDANATWTWQINSAFTQAREYFESVAIAGPTVRPLLLFYGCAALVQGSLLVLSERLVPGLPPASHGLSTVNWSGHLQKNGVSGVLDLGIVAQSGLFPAFLKAAGNADVFTLRHDASTLVPIRADYGLPRFIDGAPQVYTLGDLLQRDHRTSTLYEEVTGQPAKAYRTTLQVLGPASSTPDAKWEPVGLSYHLRGPHPVVSAEMVQRTFGEQVTVRSIGGPRYKHVPLVHLDWEVALRDSVGIPMLAGDDSVTWFSEDFDNGDRLTLLHRTYLCAFGFGMLARYHPAIWMALLQNVKGAVAQPLIRASLDVIEEDFPRLISRYLS